MQKLINKLFPFLVILLLVTWGLLYAYTNNTPEMMIVHYDIRAIVDTNFSKLDDKYHIYAEGQLEGEEKIMYETIVEFFVENAPLYKNDYCIVLTNETIPSTITYEDGYEIAGVTNAKKQVITINYDHITTATPHELGHAVDNTYHFTETEEFKALYEKCEYEYYYTSTIAEYFAENYARFINKTLTDEELIKYYENITSVKFHKDLIVF